MKTFLRDFGSFSMRLIEWNQDDSSNILRKDEIRVPVIFSHSKFTTGIGRLIATSYDIVRGRLIATSYDSEKIWSKMFVGQ